MIVQLYAQQAPLAIYPGPASPARAAAAEPPYPPGVTIQENRSSVYTLPPLSPDEKQIDPDQPAPQIGVTRPIPPDALNSGTFVTLADGRGLWRFTIASPSAIGLRVHFTNFDVGNDQVWIYNAPPQGGDLQIDGPFSGTGRFDSSEFWTRTLPGSEVTVEFLEAASGTSDTSPPFRVDQIVHAWETATDTALPPAPVQSDKRRVRLAAASCDLDIACYSAYQKAANGVVLLSFVSDEGFAASCSGSMVNTRAKSFRPYLLTANHCISSQSEAESVVAYFFYQSAQCNQLGPSIYSLPQVAGASFLAGAPVSGGDFSFLELKADVPAGTSFLGWNVDGPAVNDAVLSISHPRASWKKISFGYRTEDAPVLVQGLGTANADRFYQIDWTLGRTEGGSSGAPLLNTDGQILGTLTGGPITTNVCTTEPYVDDFGRFSNVYPLVRQYLEDMDSGTIQVSPVTLTFDVNDGQYVGPSQQNLMISTNGQSVQPYTLTASDPWIHLSSTSGTVDSSAASVVAVSIDPGAFTASTHAVGTIQTASGNLPPVTTTVYANVSLSSAPFHSNVILSVTPNPVIPDAAGKLWEYYVTLTETAGVPTTFTKFTYAIDDYSSKITDWFGSDQVPANGTLTTQLQSQILDYPVDVLLQAEGRDASGYTWKAQTTITFAGPEPPQPAITDVVNGASLKDGLSSGEWVTIQGTDLSNVTQTYSLVDGQYPTSADGLTVTVNGSPAFLYYASPTQLNVIMPDLGTGVAEVMVENASGRSEFTTYLQPVSPAAFVWPGNHAVATDTNYAWKIKDGTFPGTTTSPAASGDIIILWATGLGATSPPVTAGGPTPADRIYPTAQPVQVFIGGKEAEVLGAALAPNLAALYQIAIRVPDVLPGEHSLKITIGNVDSPIVLFTTQN